MCNLLVWKCRNELLPVRGMRCRIKFNVFFCLNAQLVRLSNILKKLTTWSIEKLWIFDLSRNVFWLFCVAPWDFRDFPRVHWSRRIIPDVPASSERGNLRNVKICKHFKKFSNSYAISISITLSKATFMMGLLSYGQNPAEIRKQVRNIQKNSST